MRSGALVLVYSYPLAKGRQTLSKDQDAMMNCNTSDAGATRGASTNFEIKIAVALLAP